MNKKYAVIDLETTGGIAKRDKITEIAVIIYDGEKVVDEFQSLINPERSIPAHITRITGITNDMVADAPRFYEVAKRVIEMTEGCVFVAHNVRFDYSFMIEEFKSLGYTFSRRNLCTVRLSRKAFPGLKSYSLGNLIKYFGISVDNRHRAYDDAYATTILLDKIFKQQHTKKELNGLIRESIKITKLPKGLDRKEVEELPSLCGVYYFLDESKEIIYIGKSKNIYKRVKQHFGKNTRKADRLFKSVHHIAHELTGSELVSLILESYEIKKHQPEINKIQKTKEYNFALVESVDKSGYFRYEIKQRRFADKPLSFYGSRKSGLNHIEQLSENYDLCLKINGIEKQHDACFKYGIQKCRGACIGEEFPLEYNQRFVESRENINRLFNENFVILDHGRQHDELAVVLIEEGHFKGFGYANSDIAISHIDQARALIKNQSFNPEVDLIIRNHIWSNPYLNIVYF